MNAIPRFAQNPCGGLRVRIASASAVLRSSGALWLEMQEALIVADLHFEKGSFFAKRGQMLPPYDTAETLARLEAEVAALSPRMIVALGDSFHDADGENRLGSEASARIAALAVGRTLVWIAGNHDVAAEFSLAGETADELELGGLLLRHEPLPGDQVGEAAGHLHPCAKVSARGGSVRRRCFITDGRRVVLPAFGAYAGGLNVKDQAFAPLFPDGSPLAAALGRDRVHAIGWGSLRGD
jgi:DNA ligase-associated metallophosphoesterase